MTPSAAIVHARRHARALHRRFGLGPNRLVDVYDYAEHLKVKIVDNAPLVGALAQLIVNGRSARILLSSRLRGPAQRRFAVAHELGHYLLEHSPPGLVSLCEMDSDPSQAAAPGRDFEREADSFARELLVLVDEVAAYCHERASDLQLSK